MPIKPLNRRAFIRGAACTLSLPFLEAMLPVNKSWAATPSRFATLYMGSGMLSGRYDGTNDMWSCGGDASGISTYSAALQAMAAYASYMTIVQNCGFSNLRPDNDSFHAQSAPSFLTGLDIAQDDGTIPSQSGSSYANMTRLAKPGISLDRMLAASRNASLKSLMMGVGPASGSYFNTGFHTQMMTNLSWDSQTAHLTDQTFRNTADLFNRLISSGLSTSGSAASSSQATAAQKAAQQKKSVLDSAMGDINTLLGRLGSSDKQVVNQYLDALRTIETNLQQSTPLPATSTCSPIGTQAQSDYTSDTNVNYDHVTKTAHNMIELMAISFQCGITDVATLMLSYDWSEVPGQQLNAAYGGLNTVQDNYHNATHYTTGAVGGALDSVKTVNIWHTAQLAYLAQVFKNTPDANGGNLLDNSLVLFGAGMGDPDDHSYNRMVRVLLGKGALHNPGTRGRVVDAGDTGNAHARLLQTIAGGFGLNATVGDSGGATIGGIIG
jgi:hypothetical protein